MPEIKLSEMKKGTVLNVQSLFNIRYSVCEFKGRGLCLQEGQYR
jgi:hypothetical protein